MLEYINQDVKEEPQKEPPNEVFKADEGAEAIIQEYMKRGT